MEKEIAILGCCQKESKMHSCLKKWNDVEREEISEECVLSLNFVAYKLKYKNFDIFLTL